MRSADYPALKSLALEEERTILREIENSQKACVVNGIVSGLLWAIGVWVLSFNEIASLTVYVLALVFTMRASENGLSASAHRLSVVSRLIGMEHYASVIHSYPRAATVHDFVERVRSLEAQGIPYDELVKLESDRRLR